MLKPYPDEFVVKMLELLNPGAALKILQRFDSSRRETNFSHSFFRNNAAVDAQSNLSRTYRRAAHAATAGSFSPDNDRRRSYGANSTAREKKRLSPTRS